MNKLEIILNNMSYGANKMGIESGIDILLKEKDFSYENKEIIYTYRLEENFNRINLKYINTVVDTCKKISESTRRVIKQNRFPLTIGGDHSIALGSISGVAKEIKNLGIIWIDAHGDMNTDEISESGHIHGMPLAALIGLGAEELTSFLKETERIKSKNIVLFGIRDLDLKEEKLIKEVGIKVFDYSYIKKNGFKKSLEEASNYLLSQTDIIHISFDLDAINPKFIAGVSTPVMNGFSINEGEEMVKFLFKNHKIKSMDIVEYNPLYDINKETLKFLKNLINIVKEEVKEN